MKAFKNNFRKRTIAAFTAMMVLLASLLSVTVINASAANYSVCSRFDGTGTSDDPYIISNADELFTLAMLSDEETYKQYYRLANDIALNDTNNSDWYKKSDVKRWITTGSFAGYLDGNKHKVTGLFIKAEEEKDGYYGLFAELKNPSVIKNLTIDKAYISVSASSKVAYGGAIAGFVSNGATLKQCYVGPNVYISARRAGGLIGGASADTVITSCAFVGTITDFEHEDLRQGGFAGDVWSGTVKVNNSFTSYKNTAAINWIGKEEYSASYCSGKSLTGLEVVSAANMAGQDAKIYMPKLDWAAVWAVSEGYPVFSEPNVWSGEADTSWEKSGNGDKNNPYLIHNAEQLYSIVTAGKAATKDKYFRLENNIYLNDIADEQWNYSKSNRQWYISEENGDLFAGNFDGNGYSVYGLYYNTAHSGYYGLFPRAEGLIEGLTVDKAYINVTNANSVGVIAGEAVKSQLKISKCFVGADVTITSDASQIDSETNSKKVLNNSYDEPNTRYETSGFAFDYIETKVNSKPLSSFGAGVYEYGNSGRAMRVSSLATRSNMWPGQFWLIDEEKNAFVPKLGVKYKIRFKYRVNAASTTDDIHVELRWSKNGQTNIDCAKWSAFIADELLVVPGNTTHSDWQIFEKEITLESAPDGQISGLFIALSDSKDWSSSYRQQIEMWFDDITLTEIENSTTSETNIGGIIGTVSGSTEINDTAFTGNINAETGKAIQITRVGFLEDQWASALKIMNADNTAFKPKKSTDYTLSFKYKVVKPVADRDAKIELRYTNTIGSIQLEYANVLNYEHIIGTACTIGQNETNEDWQEVSFNFSTGEKFGKIGDGVQLYLTVTDTLERETQWRSSIELLIDDIKIMSGDEIAAENSFDTCAIGGRADFYNSDCGISVINGGVKLDTGIGFAANVSANAVLSVSNSFTTASKAAAGNGLINYDAVYCTGQNADGLVGVSLSLMSGLKAQFDGMPQLEWGTVWKTTEKFPAFIDKNDVFGTVGAVWSGKAATWISGDGSDKHPFIIDTPERLYLMVISPVHGANYSITEDIRLNDTTKSDWYKNKNLTKWYETKTNRFSGIVDSNKKDGSLAVISGLYKDNVSEFCALIPTIDSGSEIKNIRLINSYLAADYDPDNMESNGTVIAGITGYVDGTGICKIENCIVEESVVLNGGWRQGGIAACVAGNAYIANCSFRGVLKGKCGFAGGIVGDMWGYAQVSQCYTVGSQVVNKFDPNRGRVDRCYSDMDAYKTTHGPYHSRNILKLSVENMQGTTAAEKMNELDFANVWHITDKYPDIQKKPLFFNGTEGAVWSGKEAKSYASGDGTEQNPYIIKTGEQLFKLIKDSDTKGKYYRLSADIRLNSTEDEYWYEKDGNSAWAVNWISSFEGIFDGNYHTVTGLYMKLSDGQNVSCALIPYACNGAIIKNVGIVNSVLELGDSNTAASVVGVVKKGKVTVSECFGTADVILNSGVSGGIIGSVPEDANVDIKNCSFTGDTSGNKNFSAAIIGQLEGTGSKVDSCFGSTAKNSRFIGGGKADINNCYYYGSYAIDNVNMLTYKTRIGLEAANVMNQLDFEKIWMAVNGGTPVLRHFANAEKYSDKSIRISTISFDTGATDVVVMPYSAEIDSPLNMPRPTRKGYIFGGWYIYPEFDIPFEFERMPLCDLTVYAKWLPDSVVQDFENYPATGYDMGYDYQYYKPGARGYTTKFTHGGFKSIHRLGETEDEQDFLLNYESPVIKGQEYEMTFWVYKEGEKKSDISLVYNTWPDISEPNVGVEKIITLGEGSSSGWQMITYKFIARSEYLSIRTEGGTSIYFDDFMLIATSKPIINISDVIKPTVPKNDSAEISEIPNDENTTSRNDTSANNNHSKNSTAKSEKDNSIWLYLLSSVCAVVVISGAAVVIVILKKRKQRQITVEK